MKASYAKLLKTLEFYKKRNMHYQYIVTLINLATYYRLTDNRAKAKIILKNAYKETVAHKQTLLQIKVLQTLFACDDDNELDYSLITTAIRQAQANNLTPFYPNASWHWRVIIKVNYRMNRLSSPLIKPLSWQENTTIMIA